MTACGSTWSMRTYQRIVIFVIELDISRQSPLEAASSSTFQPINPKKNPSQQPRISQPKSVHLTILGKSYGVLDKEKEEIPIYPTKNASMVIIQNPSHSTLIVDAPPNSIIPKIASRVEVGFLLHEPLFHLDEQTLLSHDSNKSTDQVDPVAGTSTNSQQRDCTTLHDQARLRPLNEAMQPVLEGSMDGTLSDPSRVVRLPWDKEGPWMVARDFNVISSANEYLGYTP
ncbi:hypothetical protein ACH5RR_033630 [Cinchona calisaya]|uniref:Uncharacterized protein n=1 Tax=Cinchona calisaya TaxID=153742 RepID=A0ABD2Y8I1_9GENT